MSFKKGHDKPEFKARRKEQRKSLTSSEAYLWKQLQNRKLAGRKFRRQHGIDNYIVDFYCVEEALIIELDGQIHMNSTTQEYDGKRTSYLEGLGFKVIRFENKMVFEGLPSVLQKIEENFI